MIRLVLVVSILLSHLHALSWFNNEKKEYLQLIYGIKDTIITTQKTRGLTNNYMNGNVVAQLLVYGQRKQMTKNFMQLNKAFGSLELDSYYYQNSVELMARSKQLNKRAFKSDSAEIFTHYSSVIESWMDLNDKIITEAFSQSDAKAYERLKFMNNVLLPLTENIGKMRGLGSGIVARTYCKEDEMKKMEGFVSEIKRYTSLLEYHLKQTNYSALRSQERIKIEQNIQDYAELTKMQVIGQSDINLNTNAYFDQGTRAIKDVIMIYNVIASTL